MKLKSIPMMLTLLLFIIGILEFIMIFMKLKLPPMILTVSTIFLFISAMSVFIRTGKSRKLAYPLITIYFLVGIPFIWKFINNKILFLGIVVVSFFVTMIFLYSELIIINKQKNCHIKNDEIKKV